MPSLEELVLSPQDREQIWKWNASMTKPQKACIHDLIQERTTLDPGAPAICSWEGNITYGELDQLSTALSFALIANGVRPEVLVPLCFDKSMWTVVAILAVLKAGGAFVLLDPKQPKNRLEHIIRETKAGLILASPSHMKLCRSLTRDVLCVTFDTIVDLYIDIERPSLSAKVGPKNAAYVIFTSGSSGQPKGVVIEHEQVSTYSVNIGASLGFTPRLRMFQFSSYTFDACILEIITTLAFGGCICVPSEQERMNDPVRAMNSMRVNYALFTPSVLKGLLAEEIQTIETIILGGESIPAELVDEWSSRARLVLAYGPAECCVICMTLDLASNVPHVGDLGRAAVGRTWIVDPKNPDELLPIGEIGELLIEGPTLARGYLNDEKRTSLTFIKAPVWSPGSSRFYRTGDLVKYQSDGRISFMGRKDFQVKLRGQRFELEEVEHLLRRHLSKLNGGIEAMVDLITPSGGRTPLLVAFLAVGNAAPLCGGAESVQPCFEELITTLRCQLEETLPVYMVPSFYVPVQQILLNASGKIDRRVMRVEASEMTIKQLSEFSGVKKGQAAIRSQQFTPSEDQIRELWVEALSIDSDAINRNSNFFSVGGNSLEVMKIVSAARSRGLYLTVDLVFSYPQLWEMAAHTTQYSTNRVDAPTAAPFSLLPKNEDIEGLRRRVISQCKVDGELIEDIYPCSPMQRGLLALSVGEGNPYVMQWTYELPESVDITRFQESWQKVADGNPILRTRFFDSFSTGLNQVVLKDSLLWASPENEDWEVYLQKARASVTCLGYPTAEYALVKGPEALHYLFTLTIHHAVMDGWSLSRIISDVAQVYSGDHLESTMPFSNFIRYLSQVDLGPVKDFWGAKLEDAPPPSFPHFPSPRYCPRGDKSLEYGVSLSRKSHSNITTATIVSTAWCLLMAKYSNSSDVVTGMTLSGRTAWLDGIENIRGPTITTVPFRMRIDREELVSNLLADVQVECGKLSSLNQLSLKNISELSPSAEQACNSRCLLVIQPQTESRASHGVLSTRKHRQLFLDHAITIECELSTEGVNILSTFDENVVSGVQMQRILHQLAHIIRALAAEDETKKVKELSFLNPNDLSDILEWNSLAPQSVQACLQDMIADRRHAHPHAQAISAWDGSATYEELDTLTSRLATYLRGQYSILPGSLVPLCFEKSMWTVVAMLSVLKAGAVCVPLDPTHPSTRLQNIVLSLGDSWSGLVLTSKLHQSRLDGVDLKANTLAIERGLFDTFTKEAPTNSHVLVKPCDPAFIIFTSGSTGNPKAIVLEHQGVCTSGTAHGKLLGLNSKSRVLQFAAYTFDISIGDIFATLMHGGCVCVPSDYERMNDLAGAMNAMQVNQASLTPTLVKYMDPEETPGLEVLTVAGECMPREVIEKWAHRVRLMNMYGPAECTIYCAGKRDIQRGDQPENIGKGVGCRLWVTDPDDVNSLAPIGAVGELLVQGPIVARGYLNDYKRTRESFVEDLPWMTKVGWIDEESRRGYRTGDLVRYNSDGTLSCLGRKDGQIKLRGQRVELGEVEYNLRKVLPSNIDVAVDVFKSADGTSCLASFISGRDSRGCVPHEQLEVLCSSAKSQLSSLLPPYMVPTMFYPLEYIPTTTSRKVNRKKLRQMATSMNLQKLNCLRNQHDERSAAVRQLPTTTMELALQKLWASVLSIDPQDISLEDSFLMIGGDSIHAMRLVAAARDQGIFLSVADVLRQPLLSDLVQVIHGVKASIQLQPSPLSLVGVEDNIELFLQQRVLPYVDPNLGKIENVLPITDFQEVCINNVLANPQKDPIYHCIDLPSSIDISRLRQSCQDLVRHFDILRTAFIRSEGQLLQVVLENPKVSVDSYDTDEDLPALFNRACETDITSAVKLKLGEMFAGFIILRSQKKHVRLVLRLSHSQYDGMSFPTMFAALSGLYDGKALPKAPSYGSLIEHGASQRPDAYGYWRSLLRESTISIIPTPYGEGISGPEHRLTKVIPAIKARSSVTPATIFSVACAIMLGRMSGSSDVVFARLVSGRSTLAPELQNIVGPCCNMIPVRVRLDPAQSLDKLLASAQDQFFSGLQFETVGFNEIRDNCTDWPRTTSDYGLFINFRNIDAPETKFAGGNCKYGYYSRQNIPFMGMIEITVDTRGEETILSVAAIPRYSRERVDCVVEELCNILSDF